MMNIIIVYDPHQDEKTDFDDLPFPAQLNVQCDHMATAQLERQLTTNEWECTNPNPFTPRNLAVEVAFGSQIISSHYISRLREAICLDRHKLFLQSKYRWDNTTWDSIDWEAFASCARRPTLENNTNRSKLVHNWLNLGVQRAQIGKCSDSALESRCPYCDAAEDFVHLLTCPAPRAHKVRYDAMMVLRKVLGGSKGGAVILNVVKTWTMDPLVSVPLPTGTGSSAEAAKRAVHSQSRIGWHHLFRGFVSLEWGNFYSDTDVTPFPARQVQAIRSNSQMLKALQEYSLSLWKHRNEVLHESGSSGLASVHATLNQEITRLYSVESTFSPILRSYFMLPLADRLRKSVRQRTRWLRLAQLAASHASSGGSRQAMLSTYFPYTTLGVSVPSVSEEAISSVSESPTTTADDATAQCATVPAILTQISIVSFLAHSVRDPV